jgi:hypothetical protein
VGTPRGAGGARGGTQAEPPTTDVAVVVLIETSIEAAAPHRSEV